MIKSGLGNSIPLRVPLLKRYCLYSNTLLEINNSSVVLARIDILAGANILVELLQEQALYTFVSL